MIASRQVVTLLLALQIISAVYLLTINPLGPSATGRFTLFLATDLLSFSLVTYVYTRERWGEAIGRVWIFVGSVGLIILLLSSLYIP